MDQNPLNMFFSHLVTSLPFFQKKNSTPLHISTPNPPPQSRSSHPPGVPRSPSPAAGFVRWSPPARRAAHGPRSSGRDVEVPANKRRACWASGFSGFLGFWVFWGFLGFGFFFRVFFGVFHLKGRRGKGSFSWV